MKIYFFLIVLLTSITLTRPSDNNVTSDIQFWLGQFQEHAEFARDFTQDVKLIVRGNTLMKNNEDLLKQSRANKNLVSDFLKIADEMLNFQNEVQADVKKQKNGNKDLLLSLLEHMNKETNYAKEKANGKKLSKADEAAFWSTEFKEEAEAMSKLVKDIDLKNKAEEIANSLKAEQASKPQPELKKVELANDQLNKLGKEIDKRPKSSFFDKLGKHEERERKYAQDIFNKFENK